MMIIYSGGVKYTVVLGQPLSWVNDFGLFLIVIIYIIYSCMCI
jgi:hypothetical protein